MTDTEARIILVIGLMQKWFDVHVTMRGILCPFDVSFVTPRRCHVMFDVLISLVSFGTPRQCHVMFSVLISVMSFVTPRRCHVHV